MDTGLYGNEGQGIQADCDGGSQGNLSTAGGIAIWEIIAWGLMIYRRLKGQDRGVRAGNWARAWLC